MLELIKKSLNKIDWLILLAAAFLFINFDYENLSLFDKFYIGAFVLWFVMLVVRVYIIYKNDGGQK